MKIKTFRLGELGKMIVGGDKPTVFSKDKTEDCPIPIFSNGLENDGLYGYTDKARVKDSCLTISARGTVGAVFFRKEPFLPIVRLIAFVPNLKLIDAKYLYYYLSISHLDGFGTSQQQITAPYLSRIKISIFEDIKYQHRIASILSAYDNLIENNNKRIRLLEQMAENLYKEWFVRFRFPGHEKAEFENGLPKGWEERKIGDWGIMLDTGNRPKGGIDDSLSDGIPSLGAEAIKDLASFDYSSTRYIPREFYDKMKRGRNTGNDILLYKDGAYIGKVTLFRDGFPFSEYAINEHVFFISPMAKDYNTYLYFTLHQEAYFSLMQNLNRNAAQPGLSRPDIERVKIIVPSVSIINEYNLIVEPMLSNIFKLAKQNTLLAKQRDLLLPRLMSGKLEVKL